VDICFDGSGCCGYGLQEWNEAGSVGAADNSRCHVCHINYDKGEFALNHELGDISREGCHVIV
jgi:hypothetical protein